MKEEDLILADLDSAVGRLVNRLQRLSVDLAKLKLADDLARFQDLSFDEEIQVLAFFKTFEQTFDLTSRQLMRSTLLAMSEKIDGFSASEAYTRLEKIGMIAVARFWSDTGRLRNRLTHSYPLDSEKQFMAFATALSVSDTLITEVANLRQNLRNRGLLEGMIQ